MQALPTTRVRAAVAVRSERPSAPAPASPVVASWASAQRRPGVAPRWKPWFRVSAT
jgi:hypothetical protein